MNRLGQPGQAPADSAGESRAFGPSFAYIVLAVLVVAGSLVYGLQSTEEPAPAAAVTVLPMVPLEVTATDATPADGPDPASAAGSAPAAIEPRAAAPVERDGDLTPDLTVYLNPGEKPTMGEVIDRLRRAGVTTGVAAFNPPGTSPPLVGLAVPDGFALPDGYMRHHQTTDDGQEIEAILMFSPEQPRFASASGQVSLSSRDLVVPPELAPPGLALRRIVVPPSLESTNPGN